MEKLNLLSVKPSIEWIDNDNGYAVFDITNISNKKVWLNGYRMWRVSPAGIKSFYYQGDIAESQWPENRYSWTSSDKFKILLCPKDRHIYNWNIIDLQETYGITKGWKVKLDISCKLSETGDLFVYSGECNV